MPDLLTTDEAATYLRLSERKLYELVANGAIPCSKVTGRWLFPKAALDRWVAAGLPATAPLGKPAPPIVGGSHDPLLEWALRESGSGLATLPEGSETGLRRLAHGEVVAAAIHLHRIEGGEDDTANAAAVASAPGLHDVVVLAFARREQGLLVAPGNPLKLSDIGSVAAARAGVALRPNGAGAQLLLLALLAQAKLPFESLNAVKPICPTGPDVAQAVRIGRADCGVATRAVALSAGLGFVPLTWERFDLALRHRDYFLPGPQALFQFLHTAAFGERAAELKGYDVAEAGQVRHIN
jgi:putative molybdopterin biosynthesis protein